MTSLDENSICFHWSVSMLLLIRKRERDLCGSTLCIDGYIGIQSLAATVTPNALIAGSWSVTMSIPVFASLALDIRSCWHMLDLLTFCCHIVRVEGFILTSQELLRLVSGVLAISSTHLVVVPVLVCNQNKGRTYLHSQCLAYLLCSSPFC